MPRDLWRLAAVVAIQLGILALIPGRQVQARISGREITLRTLPVDPYDVLSGYYVALRFEAQEPPPELVDERLSAGGSAWLVLQRDAPAWRAVALARDRPPPSDERVAIRAHFERGHAAIPSVGRFYVPEARRGEVEAALARTRGVGLVDVRVDGDGRVALVRLRVEDLVVEN